VDLRRRLFSLSRARLTSTLIAVAALALTEIGRDVVVTLIGGVISILIYLVAHGTEMSAQDT
jgi:hypothetical protein